MLLIYLKLLLITALHNGRLIETKTLQIMKKYLSFIMMAILLVSCKSSLPNRIHVSTTVSATENGVLHQDNKFYGLPFATRYLATYPTPDSVNRPKFVEIKKQFEANGWFPESETYITPRNITQVQFDSLKAVYYPLALRMVSFAKDSARKYMRDRWQAKMQYYKDYDLDPGAHTLTEYAELQPVNLIPCFVLANSVVNFYEQDPATRNIMDYLKLDSIAYVVMANPSGTPTTVIAIGYPTGGGGGYGCKDYTDKMMSFSFLYDGIYRVPYFDIAFIRNDTLYGLELSKGWRRVGYTDSNKDTTFFEHEVYLYNVQDAYNRMSNILRQSLENRLKFYESDKKHKQAKQAAKKNEQE